jgi:hypothetical protein
MINGVEENNNNTFTNNSSNISKNIITLVMYIKDIQKYTKLHIYPICGYIPPATNNGSYHRERFEEHINNCDGGIKKSLCLNEFYSAYTKESNICLFTCS